jgi:hypothetical protein
MGFETIDTYTIRRLHKLCGEVRREILKFKNEEEKAAKTKTATAEQGVDLSRAPTLAASQPDSDKRFH